MLIRTLILALVFATSVCPSSSAFSQEARGNEVEIGVLRSGVMTEDLTLKQGVSDQDAIRIVPNRRIRLLRGTKVHFVNFTQGNREIAVLSADGRSLGWHGFQVVLPGSFLKSPVVHLSNQWKLFTATIQTEASSAGGYVTILTIGRPDDGFSIPFKDVAYLIRHPVNFVLNTLDQLEMDLEDPVDPRLLHPRGWKPDEPG